MSHRRNGISPSIDALAALGLFALTLSIYLVTLAPGVYGFDSAELATGVYVQGIVHPPGYPLYMMLGKVFVSLPFGDVAYRLNLMSAFFASCTVALLYLVARQLVLSRLLALAASAFLAFSIYFWQMALIAEVYTLHTALLTLCLLMALLWCRKRKAIYLYMFALGCGLSLTNHTSAVLLLPGFVLIIIGSRSWNWKRWWVIAAMLGLFIIGLLPYAYFPIRVQANPALNYTNYYDIDLTKPSGIWWMASSQTYRVFAFGYGLTELPGELLRFGSYLWRNYLGVGVLIGLAGIYWLWRKRKMLALGLLVCFAAYVIFYINYRVIDKDTMFLPAYLIWALFIAGGLFQVHDWLKRYAAKRISASNIAIAGGTLLGVMLIGGILFNWRWVDMRGETQYQRFAEVILGRAEPDSIVIAPWSPATVLEYFQTVQGRRPDLLIINRSRRGIACFYELWKAGMSSEEILHQIEENDLQYLAQEIVQHTIYTIEYDPIWAGQYEYLPEGNYFRLAIPVGDS
jgi:4-amino-4-deoxy-L-arabinose transferase-like glycosyltransferase